MIRVKYIKLRKIGLEEKRNIKKLEALEIYEKLEKQKSERQRKAFFFISLLPINNLTFNIFFFSNIFTEITGVF